MRVKLSVNLKFLQSFEVKILIMHLKTLSIG